MTIPDPSILRSAFGAFMTGVTVVTARQVDGTPVGFTANSFSSVSLDPPLLLVCPGKFLSSYQTFATCTHFAVSVLAEGQEDIASVFARSKSDRFAETAHHDDLHGVPVIDGAIAQFSCTTHQVVEAGDHCVLLGRIVALEQSGAPGLGYVSGRFFSLGTERAALDHGAGTTIAGAIVQDGDHVLLQQTPAGLAPLHCAHADRGALLDHLRDGLRAMGVQATLGQAYSVFDDTGARTHHSYFLATGVQSHPHPDVVALPIIDLPTHSYASPAIRTMMHRFAREASARSFGLYFGDTEHGAVHAPIQRM
ncbi:flavin reductase family protein [uncultured Tateyamaria sp.]|uniref:flavin reductase family protein n=1 Tax=uncultured Tateyamaria sp. TaxID=455651 RepID=UPI00260E1B46|nr:flavin reductase family protein [uncultured Tateyamaria sp.]